MIIHPMITPWLIIPLSIFAVSFCVWRLLASRSSIGTLPWLRRGLMIIVLVAIALRPTLPGGSGISGSANINAYLVIDTTTSMVAEDYQGNKQRLSGVREDTKKILEAMPGARYSVLSFANDAYVELPLTSDSSAVQSLIDTLQPEITFYASGSSIDTPIESLTAELKRSMQQHPDRQRIVFYFGDGEQTTDSQPQSFASLSSLISGGAVFGYGTEAGGKMKVNNGNGKFDSGYVKDYSNITNAGVTDALSKIDQKALNTVATQLKVPYLHREGSDNIDQVIAAIDMSNIKSSSSDIATRQDIYWVGAVTFVLLVGWELWGWRQEYVYIRARKATND